MSNEPTSMGDRIELTWGVMEEALGKAADIMLQITDCEGSTPAGLRVDLTHGGGIEKNKRQQI